MTSSSALGLTTVTLQFTLDRDLDAAAQDTQAAISTAQRRLPPGMPSPPTMRKVNPADQPILYLSLNSPTLPLSKVDEFAEVMMAQQISMIMGVAQVNVYGSQRYAVRAQVDPNLLAARGICLEDVRTAWPRPTSTCRPARCGVRTRPSWCRPPDSSLRRSGTTR
jgi:HAE1 family hydrophobic/amphiphilic exporter-1